MAKMYYENDADLSLLKDKTIGIIGYGNMGSSFAEKLSGFRASVITYDKYLNGFGTESVQEVSLSELQERADIISFHVPLTDETTHYFNEEFIAKCGTPFYLINTSRGKVVNTEELVNGLESGQVLGACLDVLEYEDQSFEQLEDGKRPPAFDYIANSDRVILSPHVAGYTAEAYRKLSETLAGKIREHFSPR